MDNTKERERLKASFRNTLDMMVRMGASRSMLLDVIEEVLNEERPRAGGNQDGTRQ